MRDSIKILWLGLLLPMVVVAAEVGSEPSDRTALSLTIYNQDLALIREQRKIHLPAGVTDLALRGVSGRMQPETALVRPADGKGGFEVLEQNFNYDLLTPAKLLEKYVGREIRIRRTNPATGEERVERAKVLSTEGGLVVRIGDRIETNPGGSLLFDGIPANLREQPTLVTRLKNEKAGNRLLALSYLSGGLSWKADYVARLDESEQRMDLTGWVTLDNRSGASYRDARLQLVAGDLHRVRSAPSPRMLERMAVASPAAAMREEKLFAYHLYTLPRKTDILDRQTKQVALLESRRLRVEKELVLAGGGAPYRYPSAAESRLPVVVWIGFRNTKANHLGLPLPAGVVRVYKSDRRGAAQFIGEDRISHTPRDERVRLKLGNAFDVTATRLQTEWQKRPAASPFKHAALSSFRIRLHNAGERAATVTVRESIPGDWKIVRENLPHEKKAAHRLEWRVEVPPRKRATLEYSVLVRW